MVNGKAQRLGPLAWFEAQLDTMSPRDRMLAIGLTSVVLAALCMGLMYGARSIVADRKSRAMIAVDNADYAELYASEYTASAQRVAQAEEKIKANVGKPASAVVEKIAREVGVTDMLSGVTEADSEVIEGFRQTRYRVDLRKLSYGKALEFLGSIETADYPWFVDSTRFKVVKDGENRVYDLNLEVVAYQPEAG